MARKHAVKYNEEKEFVIEKRFRFMFVAHEVNENRPRDSKTPV